MLLELMLTAKDLGKENIYLHGLLVVGYGPLMLTDFRLGDMPSLEDH